MGYTPHVLVVGGGATGTGVARDLAIRGLDVTLVDRGSLASGTSGSMHGLLHSGARYAVDDPATARACRRENEILRAIGSHLVTETGGLFASLPADPDDYVETKLGACEEVGIDATELDGAAARKRAPSIAEGVERAIAVPDAVIDPFRLCLANAIDAAEHGADIRPQTSVMDLEVADGAVDLVHLRNEDPQVGVGSLEKTDVLSPDYVVNAAGPWVGEVAGMAGFSTPSRYSQGAMLVVERGGLDAVVNRCRPRTEGDIAVPYGNSAVLGTTDRRCEGPDDVDRSAAEIDALVEELSALVPDVATGRPYRAYWGVRALPPEEEAATVDVSRTATVIDHEARDDCWGLATVFGGKLTTHRATAERVADHVCAAFGIDRACLTAERELPAVPPTGAEDTTPDPILCHDAGVRQSAVEAVLEHDIAATADDLGAVSRLTRAGMGACQGDRCAHRLAVQVDEDGTYRPVERALDSFADARWAGRRHALWGENAAGAMATYDLHVRTLYRDGRPADGVDPLEWERFDAGGPTDRASESEEATDV